MFLLGGNIFKSITDFISMARKKVTPGTGSLQKGDIVFFHTGEAKIEAAKLAAGAGYKVNGDALVDYASYHTIFSGLMFDGTEIIPVQNTGQDAISVDDFLTKIQAKK